jgi:hypothetical protein
MHVPCSNPEFEFIFSNLRLKFGSTHGCENSRGLCLDCDAGLLVITVCVHMYRFHGRLSHSKVALSTGV